MKTLLFLLITCVHLSLAAQHAIKEDIYTELTFGNKPISYSPFAFQTNNIHSRDINLQGLTKGVILNINEAVIKNLVNQRNHFISILIPVSERSSIKLLLQRNEIFTSDFKLYTSDGPNHPVDYTPGLHYKGIVEGDEKSVVAVSIFQDQIIALIATDEGNFNIGPIERNVERHHIFYNDRDLEEIFPITCSTADDGIVYTKKQLEPQIPNRDLDDCVRIYIEVNDDIVTAKGGAIPATNYITAILNQCFVIYTNDQINMVVSEIKVWTSPSPYVGTSAGQMLYYFNLYTDLFNGDLAQLLSFDSLYGGQANSLNGLCNGSPDLSKCVSGMRHNYFEVPLYSNPVDNITHEFGHLLGSNHTHACVWNGNNTSIDGCASQGNSGCPGPGPQIPPEGGTIMSYCYPSNGSFKNFSLGFGPQPGTLIRNKINAASNCLSPCGPAAAYCESSGASGTQEYINKVVLANINNTSGNNNGYANYTSITGNLNAGNAYTITLTPKFSGGNNTKYWRIYIDYNQNLDWYEPTECVAQGSANNTINYTFTVPPGTTPGTTRMRVSMKLAGYPNFCGAFPLGEVEDYTINIIGTTPTCSDGIQNQGETGIDCGGPCSPCPSCNDGIQNQGETGVDCGGPCPVCPGGVVTLLASYFENGWDSWIDGGSDVNRVSGANAYEGQYSIRLADNGGIQSAMTSPAFNLMNATGASISFYYYPTSMEAGEDFWVQYNSSGTWNTIATFVSGTHFTNNAFYTANISVPNFTPTASGSFRIQCDANDNNDQVFIDQVIITKNTAAPIIGDGGKESKTIKTRSSSISNQEIIVYPNPTHSELFIDLKNPDPENLTIRILDLSGKLILEKPADKSAVQSLNTGQFGPGMYFIQIIQEDKSLFVSRFIKQ